MAVAVITGGSQGLGLASAQALVERGWHVIVDARDGDRLRAAAAGVSGIGEITAIAGDVSDPAHRAEIVRAVRDAGSLELLVNNASSLGPSPQPGLADYPIDSLEEVFRVNVLAPLALIQELLPLLSQAAVIIDVTSDAAVEPYAGWGGYGASKAALEQMTAILSAEQPGFSIYTFDPGDMRTAMHQAAYPGEDISDRPEPESVVPSLLRLIDRRPPSGRYTAAALAPVTVGERP